MRLTRTDDKRCNWVVMAEGRCVSLHREPEAAYRAARRAGGRVLSPPNGRYFHQSGVAMEIGDPCSDWYGMALPRNDNEPVTR